MWFNSKKSETQVAQQPVEELIRHPSLNFELLPDGNVLATAYWDAHGQFNTKLFVKLVDLINSGKLYKIIQKAVLNQGEMSGDIELATIMVNSMSDPTSIVDEKPVISAGSVSRHHFTQNRIQTQED